MTHDEIRSLMLNTIKEFNSPVFLREFTLEKVYLSCNDQGASARKILDVWHELVSSGVIAPGMTFKPRQPDQRQYSNANLAVREWTAGGVALAEHDFPWAHLTEHGASVVAELSRDPVNRDGYPAHLASALDRNSIAWSYVREGLATFSHGCPTATAVLAGAAAEAMILDLREKVVTKLTANADATAAKKLDDLDKIKPIIDELTRRFDAIQKRTPLRERYEAFWPALAHRGRMLRNDAGHPTKLDPISRDDARTMLILFLDLAALVNDLSDWTANHL